MMSLLTICTRKYYRTVTKRRRSKQNSRVPRRTYPVGPRLYVYLYEL